MTDPQHPPSPAQEPSLSHDCVKRINELLADRNTKLAEAVSLSSRELIQVATTKRDLKPRGRPVSMFATFCPFCGCKLNEGKEA